MTDDLLARATRALRDETTGDDGGARFTRSRIMASVHEERVKRRTRWALLIPIAATFVAASAFGAVTGTAHRAFEVMAQALGFHRAAAPVRPPAPRAPRPAESAKPPAVAVPSTVEPAAQAPSEAPSPAESAAPALPPAPTIEPARPAAPPTSVKAERAPSATPAPTGSAPDPAFELYKAAHRAHFVDRDWSRALSAWDAYLHAAPQGALVPEARYNRALCLLRLHRNDEARAALTPFAQGRYGTYRRDDAAKLLDAMPSGLMGP